MRNLYLAVATAARRFFVVTGIPVPRFARRAHRALGAALGDERHDLREEVEALQRRLERLETMAYLDRIGRPPD